MPTRGKGFWKFNNPLTSNAEYLEKMENQTFETLCMLEQDKITDKHLRWEYLKYGIRKFTMNFSKNLVKEENKDRNLSEKELKTLIFKQISTISNVNKNFKIYVPKK